MQQNFGAEATDTIVSARWVLRVSPQEPEVPVVHTTPFNGQGARAETKQEPTCDSKQVQLCIQVRSMLACAKTGLCSLVNRSRHFGVRASRASLYLQPPR